MLKKKPKKINPDVRGIVHTVRVNPEEMRNLLARANAYTKGNVSEWIRYAALNMKPNKEDLENG